MGYYTDYSLEVYPLTKLAEIIAAIENELETEAFFRADGKTEQVEKWYEYEDHLKTVSALFPTTLVVLSGEGEESGDIWRKCFLAGEIVDTWNPGITPPPIPDNLIRQATG